MSSWDMRISHVRVIIMWLTFSYQIWCWPVSSQHHRLAPYVGGSDIWRNLDDCGIFKHCLPHPSSIWPRLFPPFHILSLRLIRFPAQRLLLFQVHFQSACCHQPLHEVVLFLLGARFKTQLPIACYFGHEFHKGIQILRMDGQDPNTPSTTSPKRLFVL